MLQQGIQLHDRFAQDERVSIRQPARTCRLNLLVPFPARTETAPSRF